MELAIFRAGGDRNAAGKEHWESRLPLWPDCSKPADPFRILLPLPNVTAPCTCGHGFNQMIMDASPAAHRMRGWNTSVAAGHRPRRHRHPDVVERQLDAQGISRHDLPRSSRRSGSGRNTGGNSSPARCRISTQLLTGRARGFHDGCRPQQGVVTETFVRLYNEGRRTAAASGWSIRIRSSTPPSPTWKSSRKKEDGFMWPSTTRLRMARSVISLASPSPITRPEPCSATGCGWST